MSISVHNLSKRFGGLTVVHAISFEVRRGEFVSLLGPSGCGKTTTLRCIAGLEDVNGGVIRIGDSVVSDPDRGVMLAPHERDIGMVFQSYAIWPHMTVAGNVGFPLSIRGVARADVEKHVNDALSIVDMLHLKDRQPSQLSGGQQQRVALARAIVGKPNVLLFDEPLSNLDAKLREGMRSEIRRLQRELDIATVYVTHDQEEALSMSDRVIVMSRGHIMQEGPPRTLYRRPSNRFVADFVGKASFLDVKKAQDGPGWLTPDGSLIQVESEPPGEDGVGYQAMLRPEAVTLSPSDAPSAAAGYNELRGVITDSHYLGAVTEYNVRAGGADLRLQSFDDLEIGTSVTLRFAYGDCRLVATGTDRADVDP
ncbi:ABC transporter ATP-binding protein [Pseudochelatococcus sp. B33]